MLPSHREVVTIMGKRGKNPNIINIPCPNKKCSYYGCINKGNIVSNGTYKTKTGKVRKLICRKCGAVFNDRKDTIFYDLRTDEKTILLALKMLVKGMSLRGVSEALNVKLDTVRKWLQLAAQHSEKVNQILMKDIKVTRVELDELWTFVKKKQLRKRSFLIKAKGGSG